MLSSECPLNVANVPYCRECPLNVANVPYCSECPLRVENVPEKKVENVP